MRKILRYLVFLPEVSYVRLVLRNREVVFRYARRESGQVSMEYVLLTIVAMLGLLGFSVLFQRAIKSYLLGVYFFMSLPIP